MKQFKKMLIDFKPFYCASNLNKFGFPSTQIVFILANPFHRDVLLAFIRNVKPTDRHRIIGIEIIFG